MEIRKTSKIFISAMLVPALLFILLLELAGRLFDPVGVSYYPEMASYLDSMIIEEPIGYRNRPGLKGDFFGVPVAINKYGMRDDDFPAQKADDEFRILLLGDSVVFGIGVTKDHMLSRQLQDMIEQGNTSDISYRVLNMGVPSYNTEQELVQLKDTGLAFNPDLVLLLFSQNDTERKMWVFEKRSGLFADAIQRSYAGSLIFIVYRELHNRLPGLIRPARAAALHEELQQAFAGNHVDNDRWESTRGAMLEISELLRKKDIPFILLLNNGNRALNDLWNREAGMAGFLVANLNAWNDPRWKDDRKTRYTNSFVDSHPNNEGNKILATLIYELLISKGLIPEL